MSVRRVTGIETEYGVTLPGRSGANPVVLSSLVVRAYATAAGPGRALPTGSGWDYADETPLRDARGFEIPRQLADAGQLTDVEDPLTANSVLSNGARLYVDHAHPEYSGPEVLSPRDAVRWDRAGEVVMRRAAAALAEQGQPVRLYKNNVDGKGASYGTHENYLVPRSVPFADLVRGLLPFFTARLVVCGAGRVGLGVASREPGFQISQRADYMEAEVGLETTMKRPIVNTRDEPHATAEEHRRLHVILGDANLADVSTYLKVGMTSLVLRLIETGRAPEVDLEDPLAALRVYSRDTSLTSAVRTRDGRRLRALDVLAAYREALEQAGDAIDLVEPDTAAFLATWDDVVDRLGRDPMECAPDLDWVAKLAVLEAYRARDGVGWTDPRLAAVDIQYSDVDPVRGLAARMRASGRLRSLVGEAEVEEAATTPPADTRAWFRGQCVSRFGEAVRAASWDSVVLAAPGEGLRRLRLPEPAAATRADVHELLGASGDVTDLLARVGGTRGVLATT